MSQLAALILVLGVAVLAVRWWRQSSAPASDVEILPAPAQVSESSGPHGLLPALDAASDQVGHPTEFLAHPAFLRAVEQLDGMEPDSTPLKSWCITDTTLLTGVAIAVLLQRDDPDVESVVLDGIGSYSPWGRYVALSLLDRLHPAPEPWVHLLVVRLDRSWLEPIHARILREWVARRKQAGELPPPGDAWTQWLAELSRPRLYFLAELLHEVGPAVTGPWLFDPNQVERPSRSAPSPPQSETEGPEVALPTSPPLDAVGHRIHPGQVGELERGVDDPAHDAIVDRALRVLTGERPQPLVLIGRPRTGKTELARRIQERLLERGWSVLEATPDQLNADMKFVGELEGRAQELARAIRPGRKLLWYCPDLHTLLTAGSVSGDASRSVARALRGDLQLRRITVLGECSQAEWERARTNAPWLTHAVEAIEVPVPDETATHDLVTRWLRSRDEAPLLDDALLRETWALARQFLDENQRPGNLFDTVKQALEDRERIADADGPLAREDILSSLARRTGLPLSLLDDRQHLDLAQVESFFGERVRGQTEAIDCLVDRLAMVKTGVTDPSRPLGVFLFAGPTGTGKTELAKTLASWLFGSSQRLIRVDMSEVADPASLDKIVGSHSSQDATGDSLVERIRQQPFSVVLLDEFEKASPEAWDLFLQVFDDGRLSDRRGRVADFRHCVILMTTNLGSRVQTRAGVGFRANAAGFRESAVHEAIEATFRPEFLNRLDRVVVFQPLQRDVMREILSRQIAKVVQRRGLRDRPWAVEWDEGALEFLLDRGFSMDLGARPLQRALERYLLAPLARTLAEQSAPDGDQFLFIRAAGNELDIDFVDPDAPETAMPEAAEPLGESAADIALDAHGSSHELATLERTLRHLEEVVAGEKWQHAREEELARTSDPSFWDSPARFETLDRFQTRERIQNATRGARSLLGRLFGDGRERISPAPLQQLALRLHVLEAALTDLAAERPGEIALVVRARREHPPTKTADPTAVRKVISMYEGWARRRGARWRPVSPPSAGDAGWACVMQGFGVASLLSPEHGMHVFEEPIEDSSLFRRSSVQVDVVPLPPSEPPGDQAVGDALRSLGQLGSPEPRAVVRRYRARPDPLVRDAARGYRTGRLERVLAGDFDLFRAVAAGQGEARA